VSKLKEYQNPEVLRKLYWEEGLSLNKIAKKFSRNSTLILHYMKRFNIKRNPPHGRKLNVDKETLENLYWRKKLSLGKIAKIFSVNAGTILYNMKKFNISRENRKPIQLPKINFTKEMLEDLYWKKRLNMNEIAKNFGLSSTLVLKYMKRFGVPRRPSNEEKIIIPKALLEHLYLDKRFSSLRIGYTLGFDHRFIRKRLEKFNIPMRSLSEALTKYSKTSFSGDLKEKAYMLGLRAGDVHSKRQHKIIRVQSTTTHPAFLEMMKDVFDKYSNVGIYKFFNKGFNSWQWFVYSDLNHTFNFLLEKPQEIPDWILDDEDLFFSFLGAYVDAEGSWVVLKSHEKFVRFVFKISSMDKRILEQSKHKLNELGFRTHLYLRAKAGTSNKQGTKYSKDFYSLMMYRKSDVIRLAQILLPLSCHKEKIAKMNLVLNNSTKKWVEVKDEILELRKGIKESRLNQSISDN